MKQGIHPNYREVCFVDLSNGFKFVTRSCASSKETIKMDDGKELPLFDAVWVREGRDLRRTVRRVVELARNRPKDPFAALRDWLAQFSARWTTSNRRGRGGRRGEPTIDWFSSASSASSAVHDLTVNRKSRYGLPLSGSNVNRA